MVTGAGPASAVLPATAPASLETADVIEGSYPSMPDEVALDVASADRLDVSVGDTVAVDSAGGSPPLGEALTVTGLLAPSSDPTVAGTVQVLASPAVLRETTGGEAYPANVQVHLAPGADADAVRAAIGEIVSTVESPTGGEVTVRTPAEQTVVDVAALSSGTDVLTGILLAFAVGAALVAGLVLSDTFSVLVAQRTRELALLRCIGAERRQIRASVLVEAAIVGLVSAVLGVLLAPGVMAVLVMIAQRTELGSFAVLSVPPSAILVGVLVGVLMTVLAALVPARAATRVAPLAALRPSDPVPGRGRSGLLRLVPGLIALLAGTGLLRSGALGASLLPGVAGGVLSFLGVVLLAPFFVPASVALVGRIARPLGVPGVLASVNAVRNPARTTSSSAALMVGVTLVTMMMVGAATARTTFDAELDENYAVDLQVAALGAEVPGSAGTGPDDVAGVSALLRVDGVESAVELTPALLTDEDGGAQPVYSVDPQELAGVLRAEDAALTDDMVLAPQSWEQREVTLDTRDGPVTLPVTATDSVFFVPLVSTATAERLGAAPDALEAYGGEESVAAGALEGVAATTLDAYLGTTVWLRLDDGLDADAVTGVQSRIVAATGLEQYQVQGAATERAAYNQIIDVMLLIVTALLAVAVLIALIGVANTLSLSVLERRRENSLLRALGLTRGQLRGMLAVEAVLIAGVAALLGSLLGAVYGGAGARSALGGVTAVVPAVPFGQLGLVLAVAVVAGLLASVLPAGRAARPPPGAGLATD
ncbi:ABC transporter permease [Arthrobacter sp. RIT-PI-e]|uniref:ABC transporter permease n=1 Tax=Arthrobacter sp. RIT-PI-e TaxID=1681197 RepID=UPI00067676E0|nr:ABC transporter permease [Arthrobacter sp. RIT-PI-e]